ncbi:hypothetical protein [Streptomyces sp. NPDC005301]|uniref:hypothetical protein n=1 Tax=Streptomyces sp. NPDC005301 TaxID=3156874 RepID=UPI0033BA14EF
MYGGTPSAVLVWGGLAGATPLSVGGGPGEARAVATVHAAPDAGAILPDTADS